MNLLTEKLKVNSVSNHFNEVTTYYTVILHWEYDLIYMKVLIEKREKRIGNIF